MNKSKKKLYGFCNGGPVGWMEALTISEDGILVAQHICSDEFFMVHDLGVEKSNWKHDVYDEFAPDGWEIEFVWSKDIPTHDGLNQAFAAATKRKANGLPLCFEKMSRSSIEIEMTSGETESIEDVQNLSVAASEDTEKIDAQIDAIVALAECMTKDK